MWQMLFSLETDATNENRIQTQFQRNVRDESERKSLLDETRQMSNLFQRVRNEFEEERRRRMGGERQIVVSSFLHNLQ